MNKASHVPDDEVPADKKKEYREYHIKTRKKASSMDSTWSKMKQEC